RFSKLFFKSGNLFCKRIVFFGKFTRCLQVVLQLQPMLIGCFNLAEFGVAAVYTLRTCGVSVKCRVSEFILQLSVLREQPSNLFDHFSSKMSLRRFSCEVQSRDVDPVGHEAPQDDNRTTARACTTSPSQPRRQRPNRKPSQSCWRR